MDPKEKDLLERTFEYSRDNNKMLKKMRTSARFWSFMRIVYWAVIIGGAIGVYYYIQPYLDNLLDIYKQVLNLKDSFLPTAGNSI